MSGQQNSSKQSLAIWKVKLQLASQGSYQAIQQVKQHVLQQTDQSHPIFKQSFYDILQQGYQLHELKQGAIHVKAFQTYKDFPLFFLIGGNVQVKCINLQGDNQVVSRTKSKGLITVEQLQLAKKFGEQNINLLTKFEITAIQNSILLQIVGSNKLTENMKRKQISEKQNNVMRRYMLFPSKQVVRVTVNSTNQGHITDRIYLLSGKACYYLDDQKQFGKRMILTCFQEGYLNPKQFNNNQAEDGGSIPSSFNLVEDNKKEKNSKTKLPEIKLYIFQQSQIMYLEENFLKDDFVKAIQLKRQQHLNQILDRYRLIKDKPDSIDSAQQNLIIRFKLNKKQVNSQIYKIPQIKTKGFLTAKEPMVDKKTKSRQDLISTTSSIKCSIRIRKSKKVT